MGWEPDPEEMPVDPSELSYEAQQALRLFNILPDKIEGMNGMWMGKDYAGLGDIMRIYKIEENEEVFELLQICISEAFKYYSQQRKMQESQYRAKR